MINNPLSKMRCFCWKSEQSIVPTPFHSLFKAVNLIPDGKATKKKAHLKPKREENCISSSFRKVNSLFLQKVCLASLSPLNGEGWHSA